MKKSKIFNWVCVVLMGVLLLLQTVVPFWTYGTDAETGAVLKTSIQAFLWYIPADKQMLEFLTPHIAEGYKYLINEVVVMPVFVLVSSIAGIAVSLISKKVYVAIIPILCGAVGAYGYLFNPAFQLSSIWVLHLVVCIAIVLAAVARVIFQMKEAK